MKLSGKQQIRMDIIIKYINGDIFLDDALQILQISERHFRRLLKSFREEGFEVVIHGNTNRTPANKVSQTTRKMIIREYKQKYYDLNVTHFREKLIDDPFIMNNFIIPSYQTIRRILVKEKLVTYQAVRKRKAFKPRKRYTKEGLMVQIDGSHHHWIIKHKPFCLTAAIDDASGKILGAKFTETETTFAAMDVVRGIVETYGSFQMLYSDRAGIYSTSKREGYTNMNRAMDELGIVCVQASTPQAKGKIERLFKTLQDRLVSEMRLRGIRTIDEANRFLEEEYLEYFNKKFGVEVKESIFRKVPESLDLDEVFTMRAERVIGSGNTFCHNGERYIICKDECLAKKPVELRFYPDGSMQSYCMGEKVEIETWGKVKIAA